MTDQVRGRSEFALTTNLPIDRIVEITQQVLDSYEAAPGLAGAQAKKIGASQMVIELQFDSASFAAAQQLLDDLSYSIDQALKGSARSVERGLTELVSI